MTSNHVIADYRLLLRDGIVMHHRQGGEEEAWKSALRDLAAADGFGVAVSYMMDHWGGTPCVELRRSDGERYPITGGAGARDQEELGVAHRLFAEDDWGENLEAARLRYGVEVPSRPDERIEVEATTVGPVPAKTPIVRLRLEVRYLDASGEVTNRRDSRIRIVTFAAVEEKPRWLLTVSRRRATTPAWFPGKGVIIAAWEGGGIYMQVGQTVFVPSRVAFAWLIRESIRRACRSETGYADPSIVVSGGFELGDDDPVALEERRAVEALTVARRPESERAREQG